MAIQMTFQVEWEEQLIAELLSMKGFFIETNVGLIAPKAGGRHEADIIAVKVDKKQVMIKHTEVGTLSGGFEENVNSVKSKFRRELRDAVKKFVKERIALERDYEWAYNCCYVYTFASRKDDLEMTLKKDGIDFVPLDSIMLDEIPQAIQNWRQGQIDSKLVKGKDPSYIQLPRKYRLLAALDRLMELTKQRSALEKKLVSS